MATFPPRAQRNASRSKGRSDDRIMNSEAPGTCSTQATDVGSIPVRIHAYGKSSFAALQDLMRTATITPAESAYVTVPDEGDNNSPDKALITDLAARARHLAHASSLRTPATSRLRVRTSINRCHTATTTTPPSITAFAAAAAFPHDSAPMSTYPPPYPAPPHPRSVSTPRLRTRARQITEIVLPVEVRETTMYDRMFEFAETHIKKILMNTMIQDVA